MSDHREGGCACGQVRYRLATDPLFVHYCHCLNCQRQTGSAFVINILIEAERVRLVAGSPVPVDVPRDDGSFQRIFRCPTCQVAVWTQYSRPQVSFVRAGTLDTPAAVSPDVHILRPLQASLGLAASVRSRLRCLLRHEGALAARELRAAPGSAFRAPITEHHLSDPPGTAAHPDSRSTR